MNLDKKQYEVLVYHAPEEGGMYGAPDEVYVYNTKAAAIVKCDSINHYYFKEVMHYYNGVDGDCIMNDSNEYLEEVFTKALVFDEIMRWHKRMQLQSESILHDLDRMFWLLENPNKEYEDYELHNLFVKEYDEL